MFGPIDMHIFKKQRSKNRSRICSTWESIRIIYEVHNKGLHLKYTGYGEGAERLKGIKAIPTSTLPIFTIQLASDI